MKIKDKNVYGVRLGDLTEQPVEQLNEASRQINAEGVVLLKHNGMLPLEKNDKVAVFGRMQKHYYKSGTGSGGLVNTEYITNIFDSLEQCNHVEINKTLEKIYADWELENPYDNGESWWNPPWSQKEMLVSEELAQQIRKQSDKAIVIIARTAGEGLDNEEANYNLTDIEYETIKNVSNAFENTCVLLNVGNIMDMKWVEELNVSTVMYIWQGGQDGGQAVAEILCGKRYPSGKLTDTIAENLTDYPAYNNFFQEDKLVYEDDIFVGYRYFETFAKDKVLYPFGFGLSYTEFDVKLLGVNANDENITVKASAKNTGKHSGKEIVQVYFEAPSGKLSKPSRQLVAFAKTKELTAGSEEILEIKFSISDMASYDENGITGNKSCFVLEQGEYKIYVGTDVRSAKQEFAYNQDELKVTKQCTALLQPKESFKKMINKNGEIAYDTVNANDFSKEVAPVKELTYTGNKNIKLEDVYSGKASIEDFVAQLSNFELACLSQGEGMNSPKVRPGCGGAFGGLTEDLQKYGMPVICVTDGPSGLRLDNGDKATNIPCGTMIACTWNEELTEELYTYEGMELYAYSVDALLGPGINIHRFPLCGRNFEYLSEDPYLAGCIGRGMCAGLYNAGVSATIKHFAANNKEHNRGNVDTVVSETALREIYLKPFEMVIRDGKTKMVMTAYNQINGEHCAGNYDLNTGFLRDEWGYDGLVMTDWWAGTFYSKDKDERVTRLYHIKAQNDLYMVNNDVEITAKAIIKDLESGKFTRAEMQRNAINICRIILQTPTFERYIDGELNLVKTADLSKMTLLTSANDIESQKEYTLNLEKAGDCAIKIKYTSNQPELMQMAVKLYANDKSAGVFMISGTNGEEKEAVLCFSVMHGETKFKLSYKNGDADIKTMEIYS